MSEAIQKSKTKKSAFVMPVGHVMLDGAQYGFDLFASQFQTNWNIKISLNRDGNFFGFMADGMIVGCALLNAPVSDAALRASAKESVMWSEAESCVSKHNAHLMVSLAREKDPVSAHVLFTKVVYSLLHQRNVLGVYFKPGLFEPTYYMKYAEKLLSGKLPTELWVHINSYGFDKDGGSSFFTSGMNKFGKREFEIIETQNNFVDTYYLLKDLINHVITNDVTLKNGETIGPEGGIKGYLSISKGVNLRGETVKIKI